MMSNRLTIVVTTVSVLIVIVGVIWWFMGLQDSTIPPVQQESLQNGSPPMQEEDAFQDQPQQVETPQVSQVTDPITQQLQAFPIEQMRQRSYPGSQFTTIQTLPPTASYEQAVVSYQSDGLIIRALLTIPLGDRPQDGWPGIVFNHGYIPPEQYETTQRYEAYIDVFARNGYAVLKPDFRGHGLSEGDPTGAYFSPGYTVDVLNAFSSLQQDERVDANRIGMWGHSMGGYLTLRSMVISDQIQAGVIWAGVIGPYTQIYDYWQSRASTWRPSDREREANRIRSDDLIERYGEPDDEDQFWRSISPYYYLEDLSGPLQLHQGTADSDVPVIYHQTVADRITELGNQPVEAFEYQGADHNLSGSAFGVAAERSVTFFDQYLKAD